MDYYLIGWQVVTIIFVSLSSCVLREGFFLLQFLRRERELLSVNLLFGNFISQLLNNEHCQIVFSMDRLTRSPSKTISLKGTFYPFSSSRCQKYTVLSRQGIIHVLSVVKVIPKVYSCVYTLLDNSSMYSWRLAKQQVNVHTLHGIGDRQHWCRLRIWFWCFGWVWQILNQKQIQTTIWSWGHNICKCLVEGLWSQSTLSFYLQ